MAAAVGGEMSVECPKCHEEPWQCRCDEKYYSEADMQEEIRAALAERDEARKLALEEERDAQEWKEQCKAARAERRDALDKLGCAQQLIDELNADVEEARKLAEEWRDRWCKEAENRGAIAEYDPLPWEEK